MMENPTEIRTNQEQKVSSVVLGIEPYPSSSNLGPTRLNNVNVCSNPQFQNVPPFMMASFQNAIQSNITAPLNAQPPQFMSQQMSPFNTSSTPPSFAQNNLFHSPATSSNSLEMQYFNPNIPQFDPTIVANNFQFGSPRGDGLVQFPFAAGGFGYNNDNQFKERFLRNKRRIDLAELDNPSLPPSKQHITEEKMAEHMSKLHISSETVSSSTESESVKNKRLYMCEEMRKLQTDPLLPPCLLRPKPCTALVLWQPPRKVLNVSNNNESEEENVKNNNKHRLLDKNNIDDVEFDQNPVLSGMDMDV